MIVIKQNTITNGYQRITPISYKSHPPSGVPFSIPRCFHKRRASAEIVVLLVLLVWWLEIPRSNTFEYEVIEFFSGVGRIASLATHVGFKSAAVDIEYGAEYAKMHKTRSPMDLNSSAGLMWLGCFHIAFFPLFQICYSKDGDKFPCISHRSLIAHF